MRLIKLSNQTMVNPEKIEKVGVIVFSDKSLLINVYISPTEVVFTKKFTAWEGKDTEFFKPYITYLVKTGIEDDTFQKTLSIIESQETLLDWLVDKIYLTVSTTVERIADRIFPDTYKNSVIHLNKTDIYIVLHTCNNVTRNNLKDLLAKDRLFTYSVDSMEGIYNIKIAKEKHLEDLEIPTNFIDTIASAVYRKVVENYKY